MTRETCYSEQHPVRPAHEVRASARTMCCECTDIPGRLNHTRELATPGLPAARGSAGPNVSSFLAFPRIIMRLCPLCPYGHCSAYKES